jgi:FkbM family methyltransferase
MDMSPGPLDETQFLPGMHGMSGDGVAIETRYGRLATTGDQDVIGRFLMRCGEWAWDEASFVASVVPEGARALDVGAFLGTFGLGLALCRRPEFLCLVEANPTVLPLLRINIESNITFPTAVVNALVTGCATNPRVGMTDPSNLGSASFIDSAENGQLVGMPHRAMTLADLRAEYGPFSLIKLDVEGMELEIIHGDREYLSRGEATLWIECNESAGSLDLADSVLSWGLDVYYFAFPSHNPDNFRHEADPIFPWAYEAGLLVAPKTPPNLDSALTEHRCILRPIKTVEDLKEAMWRTPRWLPSELAHADTTELAAAASRALRGQSREVFLADPNNGLGELKQTIWDRLTATQEGLSQAEALAFERLDQLEQERKRRETVEALAFERLGQLEQECKRRETVEALAFERLDRLQGERQRREVADQRLAQASALALARLAEIGVERERADAATALIETVEVEATARVAEAEARACTAEQKLAELEMALMFRLAARINVFVTAHPVLHGALRRARRVGGTVLRRHRAVSEA